MGQYKRGKKIAILTLISYNNYGNRLQAFALQRTLESLGHDVRIIVPLYEKTFKERLELSWSKGLSHFLNSLFLKIRGKLNFSRANKEYLALRRVRASEFKEFSEKFLREEVYVLSSRESREKINEEFDLLVIGSDQIWNPKFDMGGLDNFGGFMPGEKCVAFAASFGVSELPGSLLERFGLGLRRLKHISVREFDAQKIVEDVSGRVASFDLDPTLILPRETYSELEEKSEAKPSKPYIVVYFLGAHLGEISSATRLQIAKFCSSNDFEMVSLVDRESPNFYHQGPGKMLDLLAGASMVITDSYHGTIFSLIYRRPFVVLERSTESNEKSVNSRLTSFLEVFGMEDRLVREFGELAPFLRHDFSRVDRTIQRYTKKALSYLEDVTK